MSDPASSKLDVLEVLGPSAGGIRRHVAALADELRALGHTVRTAGPARVLDGLATLDHPLALGGVTDPVAVARAVRSLRRILQEGSFDVVHAHGLTAGWVAALAGGQVPVVVTVHNLVAGSGLRSRVEALLQARLPSRVAEVIAVSDEVADELAGPRGSVRVVPPVSRRVGAQRSAEEVRRSLGVPVEAPLVAVVARLHPQKDHRSFLLAFDMIRATWPDARAVLVGEGPLEADLRALVHELDLDEAVVFTGSSANPADEMVGADVVVLSSRWEGDPITVVEALGLGRPIVATAVGGVPQLVEDGVSGRLVQPGDVDALAAAVSDILGDPAEAARLGAAGRVRVEELRRPERLATRVVEVYCAAIRRRERGGERA